MPTIFITNENLDLGYNYAISLTNSEFSSDRNRFQKDKLSAITLVFKEAYPGHRSRSTEGEFVVALDSNRQISHYQKVQKKREVHFPAVSIQWGVTDIQIG